VRVIECCERAGFTFKARETLRIACKRVGQDLERHLATELRIACAIDLAPPACAERSNDLVRSESGSCGEGQGITRKRSAIASSSKLQSFHEEERHLPGLIIGDVRSAIRRQEHLPRTDEGRIGWHDLLHEVAPSTRRIDGDEPRRWFSFKQQQSIVGCPGDRHFARRESLRSSWRPSSGRIHRDGTRGGSEGDARSVVRYGDLFGGESNALGRDRARRRTVDVREVCADAFRRLSTDDQQPSV
jgi:hypothetical protein